MHIKTKDVYSPVTLEDPRDDEEVDDRNVSSALGVVFCVVVSTSISVELNNGENGGGFGVCFCTTVE